MGLLQACSTPPRLPAQPDARLPETTVLGLPNARFYPDEQSDELFEEGLAALAREMEFLGISDPNRLPPASYLAISGGGGDGAFSIHLPPPLLLIWEKSG